MELSQAYGYFLNYLDLFEMLNVKLSNWLQNYLIVVLYFLDYLGLFEMQIVNL